MWTGVTDTTHGCGEQTEVMYRRERGEQRRTDMRTNEADITDVVDVTCYKTDRHDRPTDI